MDEAYAVVEAEDVEAPGYSLPTTSTWLGPSGYERLLARIREVVRAMLPPSATVLVVSKGDEELLELDGRPGWHFPRDESGKYAGYHPGSAQEAIRHLESLREAGANYILFPCTAFWWLGHYDDLAQHLIRRYQLVHADNDTCVIFALNGHKVPVRDAVRQTRPGRYTRFVDEVRDVVRSVLPENASILVISSGDDELVNIGGERARHFPQGEDGGHAGFHPADGVEAVLHLDKLTRAGAEFLVIPETEFWWLDHYTDFRHHLERVHRLVLHQGHVCVIYELRARFRHGAASPEPEDLEPRTDSDGSRDEANGKGAGPTGLPLRGFRRRIGRFWGRG